MFLPNRTIELTWAQRVVGLAYVLGLLSATGWTLMLLLSVLNFAVLDEPKKVPAHASLAFEGAGAASSLVPGAVVRAVIDVNIRAESVAQWWPFALHGTFVVVVPLRIASLLRDILRTVEARDTFSMDNVRRIRGIGRLVIAWAVLLPAIEYIQSRVLISQAGVADSLTPSFPFPSLAAIGLGCVVLVIAQVVGRGVELERESALTV